MTEYGPEIAVNGVRPEWLRDGCKISYLHTHVPKWWNDIESHYYSKWNDTSWSYVVKISLPADHPYYLATSQGFEYWPGGDKAPDDWDEGEVLCKGGHKLQTITKDRWKHIETSDDIIGYRKRSGLPEVPADATMPDDWAIKVAHKDVYGTELSKLVLKRYKQGDYSDGKAILTLARMIQQYQPHRKPVDPDVLAVRDILLAWGVEEFCIDSCNDSMKAALNAYKKHK